MQESIRPQGQFGQPLTPLDATGIEKVGYATRSLAESFVPGVAAYAGIATPESIAQYMPLYRWRALAEAKAGKNQLGITGKEPASARVMRTALNISGVPVQPSIDTAVTQGQK